jgi:predicted lipoprotein with Yx(FWY)xxD motif
MKLRTTFIICLVAAGMPHLAARAATGQEAPVNPTTPPEITIQGTPAGPLFADRKGFTLYVTDRDRDPGRSTCAGACAEQWVPLRAETDTPPFGDWALVARDDGRPQWAYKGRPLYRYRWEAKPRWAEAQNEVWRYASVNNFPPVGSGRRGYTPPPSDAKVVLPPRPGGVVGNPTKYGIVFADSKNLTLYSQKVVSPCTGACLDSWMALRAPQAAAPLGDWTIVTRSDGSAQWAYQGHPVYRSVKDIKPADVNGASDQWQPLLVPRTDKPAAKPAGK